VYVYNFSNLGLGDVGMLADFPLIGAQSRLEVLDGLIYGPASPCQRATDELVDVLASTTTLWTRAH
jgi:hypothetical protein